MAAKRRIDSSVSRRIQTFNYSKNSGGSGHVSAISPKTSRIPFRKYDFRFVLGSTRRYFSSWIEPEADLEFHQWKEESHCNNARFLRGSLFKRVFWNYQSDVEIIDGWNSLLQGRSSWLQNCFEVFETQGNEDRPINGLRVWNIHPWKMRLYLTSSLFPNSLICESRIKFKRYF